MRAGDVVYHRPSDETWVLAWGDDARGEVSACGWPETIAKAADCELVEACSDDEHLAMLREWATRAGDYRATVCRRQLAALGAAGGGDGV